MKFVVAITLYNPTKEQIENLKHYEECFEKIFLFDNSESNSQKVIYPNGDKYVLLSENGNMGLPYAFNKVLDYCEMYDYLCTMDQDSIFETKDIERMKSYIETIDDNEDIGIIAPYVDYGFNHINQRNDIIEKPWVITSGSFLNLHNLYRFGLRYDENYFIDKFEIDLCEQFKRKGCKIRMFYGSILYQQLGEKNNSRHASHNALRHYYLFRNRLYFNKKWYKYGRFLLQSTLQTIKHLYLISRYETDKIKKIKMAKIAYMDFKNGQFGKK